MIPESRLYSFIDHSSGFTFHFLEGQKLFLELVQLTNLQSGALSQYRDMVLSIQQLISFLKNGESIGFYIDSKSPQYKFKMESNYKGLTRILLFPDQLKKIPQKVSGLARLIKIFPGKDKNDYQSLIELENLSTEDIVNKLLKESYQTQAKIFLGESADQSLMIKKIPSTQKVKASLINLDQYLKKMNSFITQSLDGSFTDVEKIVEHFESNNLSYLGSKHIKFHCDCSRERFTTNLAIISENDRNKIFQNDDSIEVTCDYCKKSYKILKKEV